jgi:hypothetical protein
MRVNIAKHGVDVRLDGVIVDLIGLILSKTKADHTLPLDLAYKKPANAHPSIPRVANVPV